MDECDKIYLAFIFDEFLFIKKVGMKERFLREVHHDR